MIKTPNQKSFISNEDMKLGPIANTKPVQLVEKPVLK